MLKPIFATTEWWKAKDFAKDCKGYMVFDLVVNFGNPDSIVSYGAFTSLPDAITVNNLVQGFIVDLAKWQEDTCLDPAQNYPVTIASVEIDDWQFSFKEGYVNNSRFYYKDGDNEVSVPTYQMSIICNDIVYW